MSANFFLTFFASGITITFISKQSGEDPSRTINNKKGV